MARKNENMDAWNLVKQLLLVVLVSFFITVFIIQPYEVNGQSMEPTFNEEGDRVLAFKVPFYFHQEPDYGDVVIVDSRVRRKRTPLDAVFEHPLVARFTGQKRTHTWVKRVIGLPGDVLECIDGKVYRNGVMLDEDYIKEEMLYPFEKVVVPEGCVFVMGDNRNHSADSRHIGPIPLENVCGKVFLRYFPLNRIELF